MDVEDDGNENEDANESENANRANTALRRSKRAMKRVRPNYRT